MDNSAKIEQYRELINKLERIANSVDKEISNISNLYNALGETLIIDDMIIEEENISSANSDTEMVSQDIRYNIIEMIEEEIAELSAMEME